jgi:tripartite-type tricarboxylate transporter receptor subunit TctC
MRNAAAVSTCQPPRSGLVQLLIAAGIDLADTTLEQFDAYIKKDVAFYNRIIKESKIRLD